MEIFKFCSIVDKESLGLILTKCTWVGDQLSCNLQTIWSYSLGSHSMSCLEIYALLDGQLQQSMQFRV